MVIIVVITLYSLFDDDNININQDKTYINVLIIFVEIYKHNFLVCFSYFVIIKSFEKQNF